MGGSTTGPDDPGNDIWGWFDAQSGKEYALVGLTNGTAFVDITNPEDPIFLGRLPTQTVASQHRDIKVYQDHAYIVADRVGAHGMQVFDLTRLRGLVAPETFSADVVYSDFEEAHNLAINEESGFAYAVAGNTCGGALHIIDIRTPNNPLFAGCHRFLGPTHNTQCVIYQGPDTQHLNREICVSSNPDIAGNNDHIEVVLNKSFVTEFRARLSRQEASRCFQIAIESKQLHMWRIDQFPAMDEWLRKIFWVLQDVFELDPGSILS